MTFDSNRQTTDTLTKTEETEFNASVATLMRINEIKKGLTIATIKKDYPLHYRYLSAYYLELISIMNKGEENSQKDNLSTHRKNEVKLFHLITKHKNSIPMDLVDWLYNWESVLRNIEQEHGMNLPKKGLSRHSMATMNKRDRY